MEDKLRASIWYSVGLICEKEEEKLGTTITQPFRTMLAEVIYKQTESMAQDLESFAKHGRRSTVTVDDVKLCARRNDSLHDLITSLSTKPN